MVSRERVLQNIEQRLRPETDRAVYVAVAELRRAHEEIGDAPADGRDRADFTAWELRAFSQNGEDGVLAEILARIGAPIRSFVEFGAQSGREGNCVFLADVAGWGGVFIEADAEQFAELSASIGLSSASPRCRPKSRRKMCRSCSSAGACRPSPPSYRSTSTGPTTGSPHQHHRGQARRGRGDARAESSDARDRHGVGCEPGDVVSPSRRVKPVCQRSAVARR